MKEHLRSKILEILQACPDLAIATLRDDGFPQNTTVSFVHDGMTMYCGVGAGSQKAINMRRDPRISITMTAPYETVDRRSIPRIEMEKLVAERLSRYRNSLGSLEPEEFMRLMLEQSGILAASGSGYVEFLHLTFQEYLTSVYAAAQNKSAMLSQQLDQSWWHEAILLALAQGTEAFSHDFFEQVLKRDPLEENLGFVQRCVNEAVPFAEQPFLSVLASRKPKREKAKVLRLIQQQRSEELFKLCQSLAKDSHKSLSSLAREILDRAGVAVPAEHQAGKRGETATESDIDFWHVDEFVHDKTGIALVRIPAGKFMMGDAGWANSQPLREVMLTQDFFLGKYPVTNEEYGRFLEATDHREPEEWNDSRWNNPRQPVVGVSWQDAAAFCEWAEMKLPTEAQWEYACRAGSNSAYCFGDDPEELEKYAWYVSNSKNQTHDVGSKLPNQFGLFDVHGNVWEWCADFMNKAYYSVAPNVDPPGPDRADWFSSGAARVARGGGWNSVVRLAAQPALAAASRRRFAVASWAFVCFAA